MLFNTISRQYSRVMDVLYWICVILPAIALVGMTLLVTASVFSRYVLSYGASFFEPFTVILAIQLTFFGAAACYRDNAHIRLTLFVQMLSEKNQKIVIYFGTLLMAVLSALMVVEGIELAEATFGQGYFEFPAIPAGAIYLGIPITGAITFLFVVEKLVFKPLGITEFAQFSDVPDDMESPEK